MVTKKLIIPVVLVIVILVVLKIALVPNKLNTLKKEDNNVETYKTSVVKIGEKELNLALVKSNIEAEVLKTPYSLAVLDNGKVDYSSQIINTDILEDFENIKTQQLGDETLVLVDGLSVGAHSSGLRVFKINPDQKQIIPVCVSTDKQTKDDPCLFYADAMSEPFFDDVDKDGIDELVEMNRGIENPREVILSAVYEYENGQFTPLSGNDYEKAHEFLSKSFTSGTDEPFKLNKNYEK